MRQKNFLILIMLFIACFTTGKVLAQSCGINTNVNGIAGTGHTDGTIAQSFTACESGLLNSVSAISGNAATGFNQVVVEIFNGDGVSGTKLLTTGAVQVNSNRTVTWSLASFNLQVVAGQKYTARFTTQQGSPQLKYGTYANSAVDYYSGGRVYYVGNSWNDMFFSADIQTLGDPVLTPLDDATEVVRNTEVKMTFTRAMEAVSGNITIENITDTNTQTVDVTTLTIDGNDVYMPLSIPLLAGKDYSIVIPSGTLRATNGIPFTGLASGDWTFSTSTSPFATLSTTSADLTNDPVIPFSIDFSDVVTGFELADFVITNGVASNLSGSDDAFTFDVTPSADGEVVVSLPVDQVEAGASNGNDSTGYSLVYDGTAPSVSLDTDASGTIETSIFDVEVVFSEPVADFETTDLEITNAEVLSSTSTNDSLFTVSIRAQAEGQITVDLAAGIADDLAGNANTAAPAIIDVTFSVDLDSDLLSFYPFDGNANDTVSTGFNGTVSGATLTTGFDGATDGAYSFDGSNRITFGDTPIGAGSFSIGFWVKIPEGLGTQNRIILEKRAVCSEGRFFTLLYRNNATSGHEIVASQRNNGSATAPIASNLAVGEWMHVTYVKDNDNLSSSIFINGVQESEVAWTTTYNFENSTNLVAGSGPCVGADGTLGFIGDLDDVHVYNRALTAVEIDLLSPLAIKNVSAASGSDIQAGEVIDLTFNKNLVQSSINTTNVTAVGSVSGAIAISLTSSQDDIIVTPPSTGWPLNEDVTISLSGILAENGTTLANTDLTYSVIADEAVGLILHYPISGNVNEAIGDIAGQDGTVSGALFAEGIDGDPFGAISFDGTDDVVTLGDAPISSESFSISMWLKVPADGSTTQNSVILSKRDACSEGRMINLWYLRSGDKFKVVGGLRDNASAGSVATDFSLAVEEWVNVTFVKDNITQQYRLIVNGVLEAESSWTLSSVNVENSTSITLGTSPCVGNGEVRFDGVIDDLRIYDRVIRPRVISVAPARGTVNAVIDTVVTITFDRTVDVSSLEASTISINDNDETSYSYTTAFSNGDSVLTVTPDSFLPKGKIISVSVDTLSAQIGSDFLPFKTSFTTVSTQLLSHSPSNGVSDVDSLQTISFKFDNVIGMSSLDQGIQVIGSQHGAVEGSFTMPTTDSVVFTPSTPYFPNEMITVYVTPSLTDEGGESIGNNKAFKFHVESGVFTNPTLSFELTKLTTSGATASPRVLVPADMDGDGDLDLVGGDDSSRRLLFFENLGSGNFGTATSIAAGRGYFDVKVTDFDLDGDMDVVSVDRSVSQGLYWYENDGDGNFTEDQIVALTNTDTRSIAIADYNKDGMMDVAVASYGSNRFTVYQQDGSSLFAAANASQPIFLSEADWNSDGNMDIITGNYAGSIARWTNSGIGTFSGSGLHSAPQIRSVVPFDMDKDGDMDIVYSSQSGNQIGVLQNDGTGSFTNVQVGSVLGPHRLDVGDVDGDGDFDIVYTTAGAGADINFHYLENSGTLALWTSQRLMPNETFTGGNTQTAKFADIDNDGDLDVLATDAASGFYIFENKIIDLNNGPVVQNPIADQTMNEDAANGLTIDVTNVFVDAEGDSFTLNVSSDNSEVTATLNGNDLDITSATDFFGTATITLTADDGNGVNSDAFNLEIVSVNDAPEFELSTYAVTLDEDFTTIEVITITQNQPTNEDVPTYSIAASNPSLASVNIIGTTGEISITASANTFGNGTYTVFANDGSAANNTFQRQFELTVNSINDAPILAIALSDIALDEDQANVSSINLSGAFTDADDASLTYTLNLLSGSDLLTPTINGTSINIALIDDAFGTVEMEVLATDQEGAVAKDTLDIVVSSINDSPTFVTSGDLTLSKDFTGTETVTITADAIPFGEESQVITYTLSPASVSFANVAIDQATGEVSITSAASQFGTQEFTITADDGQATNNTATQNFTLSIVDLLPQVATFTGVADKTFGDPNFDITASVDSNLPVSFSIVSGGIAFAGGKTKGRTESNLATFVVTGAGTAIIRASNDGDDTYAPLQEDITINVAKADQVITISDVATQNLTSGPITINARSDTNLDLTYSVTGPATIADNVVTLSGIEGTVIVTVAQEGTDNYNQASNSISFEVVEKQSQTITFTDIPDLTYGAADQTLIATSSSNLAVSFSLISGPASLNGSTLSITGVGEIVLEAIQAGDDDFLDASAQQTITVSKANLTVTADDQTITYGDAFPTLTYLITGFVNNEGESVLTSSPILNTAAASNSDAGTYTIVAAGATAENYEIAYINSTFTINKVDQVIDITSIEDKEPTDVAFDVVATVDSGLELTYEVAGPATIAGSTITLDGIDGTVTVTVSQVGDVNRNAASEQISFEVAVVLALKEALSEAIKVYPNPAAEYIMIENDELVNLRFFGLNGQLIKEINQVNGKVDVSTLPTGAYLMEVLTDDERTTMRIQKTN